MKKLKVLIILLLGGGLLSVSFTQQAQLVPLLRYYNGVDHLYETSSNEAELKKYGYKHEGSEGYVYTAQVEGTVPLYRYANGKDHMYQIDPKKFGGPEAYGYHSEGICCYVYPNNGTGRLPLYRFNNGVDHLYQTDKTRFGGPEADGYKYEGIEGYVLEVQTDPAAKREPSEKLANLKDGFYMIQLASSRLVLDADGNNLGNNGCSVMLWGSKWCREGQARGTQTWQLKNLGDGLYKITLKTAGGKSLDAWGPDIAKNECKVHLWGAVDGAPGQVWKIIDHGANGFQIILNSTGKALDAHSDDLNKNGCRIQLWDPCDKCPSQMWKIWQPACQ
jgi:Ricin-type beta-trefoil lectin domain-like